MRAPVDGQRIQAFARELGRVSAMDATLYLTGGATAVIQGWRPTTIHVDIRLEPDSDELLRRIATLKDELDLNVELASPPDFIPELPGWRDRSPFVLQEGALTVRHFDPYSQALAKIERGFSQDLEDVASMLEQGLTTGDSFEDLKLVYTTEAVAKRAYAFSHCSSPFRSSQQGHCCDDRWRPTSHSEPWAGRWFSSSP